MDTPTPDTPAPTERPIFVTGVTGYVGGRLVPRLLDAGCTVRCFARDRRKVEARAWSGREGVSIVEGDVAHTDALAEAMAGCGAAYYLVHSMIAAGAEYAERDRALARSFATACAAASVERIVYLGGLGETGDGLSEHLASRREVEHALADGPVPVTVLRAAMIIGSGSASFEILRYLTERLPVMVTPWWVRTACQPIAIRDVLFYLIECLRVPETAGRTLDIGGPSVVRYDALIQMMAESRGLPKRLIVPIPVLTPRLSSFWIHLVTPLDHRIARPLAEGLRNEVVVRDDSARRLMPHEPIAVERAIDLALGRIEAHAVETSWSDAGVVPGDPDWAGGKTYVDRREKDIPAPPAAVFRAVCRVGGGHGWYAADWLWKVRGAMDRLVGGPGLRRGRRHPETVSYGDALDFWRVRHVEQDRRLDLRAEMKLPGEALLSFEIEDHGDHSRLIQTARFMPRGLLGLLYWWAVVPLHHVVFEGMLGGICRAALVEAEGPTAAGREADGRPESASTAS